MSSGHLTVRPSDGGVVDVDETEVRIAVPHDQLYALRDWLTDSEEFRGRVKPVPAPSEPDQMGVPATALSVALGSGGAFVALTRVLCTWLVQRRSDVHLTLTASDGREMKLDVERARDPMVVMRDASALFESGSQAEE